MTIRHTDRLPNGFTTVVIDMPHAHQVLVTLMIRVGSRDESPRENGISHFLEHLLFRGNAEFPDGEALNRAFESVGGMLNGHTGVEATDYEFVAHPDHLGEGLQYLASFVRTPTFAEMEKERQILLHELLYDYNQRGHLINLAALASQVLWPEHPLGQSVGGVPTTVSAISEAQVRAHHQRHYHSANAVLALVGKVGVSEGVALAGEHFGDWPPRGACDPVTLSAPPAPPLRASGPHLKLVPDVDNQFHLQLSFPAPGYNDAEELATTLLSRTLDDGPTSRLQRVLREELALVYDIAAGYTPYRDTGALEIATSVKIDRFAELLRILLEELSAFRLRGPSEDEVARARLRHLFDLEFEGDSLEAQVERYSWPLLYAKVRDEAEERMRVRTITRSELHELARRLFVRENLYLVLVGPLDGTVERMVRDAVAQF